MNFYVHSKLDSIQDSGRTFHKILIGLNNVRSEQVGEGWVVQVAQLALIQILWVTRPEVRLFLVRTQSSVLFRDTNVVVPIKVLTNILVTNNRVTNIQVTDIRISNFRVTNVWGTSVQATKDYARSDPDSLIRTRKKLRVCDTYQFKWLKSFM